MKKKMKPKKEVITMGVYPEDKLLLRNLWARLTTMELKDKEADQLHKVLEYCKRCLK